MKIKNIGTVIGACATTAGSKTVTPASMTGITVGQTVSGTGIASGSVVIKVDTSTIEISLAATATGASTSLTFNNPDRNIDGFDIVFEAGDYGGSFSTYSAGTPFNPYFEIRVVKDTHAGGPAYRHYVYCGGVWTYTAATAQS